MNATNYVTQPINRFAEAIVQGNYQAAKTLLTTSLHDIAVPLRGRFEFVPRNELISVPPSISPGDIFYGCVVGSNLKRAQEWFETHPTPVGKFLRDYFARVGQTVDLDKQKGDRRVANRFPEIEAVVDKLLPRIPQDTAALGLYMAMNGLGN